MSGADVVQKSILTVISAAISTLEFNSESSLAASTALFLPILSISRKKLFPTSSPVTTLGSRIVKWPIPGRTRFFRIEVDVAVAPITNRRALSSAAWPVAAHNL